MGTHTMVNWAELEAQAELEREYARFAHRAVAEVRSVTLPLEAGPEAHIIVNTVTHVVHLSSCVVNGLYQDQCREVVSITAGLEQGNRRCGYCLGDF